MSLRDSRFGEVKVPLAWTAAVALVVALIVALALLIGDRRETFQDQAYGGARKAADNIFTPVGAVLSAPLRWTGMGINGVRGYFFAVSENRHLKRELREASQWRNAAIALNDLNDRYRALLKLKTDPPVPMVTARVVMDSRGPFANTRLANAGKEIGVKVGNPVMSEQGLVGRIVGVTQGASRILLLTDIASRTPVMIDRTNARAILTGDGSRRPVLAYMRGEDPVRAGDRVMTSGDGGLFPRGLPVGTAVRGVDGSWRVSLDSDRAPIDFVRILLFVDFAQLVDAAELNRSDKPPPLPQVMRPPAPESKPEPAKPAPKPKPKPVEAPSASITPSTAKPKPEPKPTPPKPAASSPSATSAKPAVAPSTTRSSPATPRPARTASDDDRDAR